MCDDRIYVKPMAYLDAHVCQLVKILGQPQIRMRNGKFLTAWVFEHPRDMLHWMVSHLSEKPIVKDGGCAQPDQIKWSIAGESEDKDDLYDLIEYLCDGVRFRENPSNH